MEVYVIAGVVVAVVIAVTILGVLIYRLAKAGRSDLHSLVAETKAHNKTIAERDGFKRSTEEAQHALEEQADELVRTAGALALARDALSETHQRLAASGDASGVASSINSTLGQLRALEKEVSGMPDHTTAEDGNG